MDIPLIEFAKDKENGEISFTLAKDKTCQQPHIVVCLHDVEEKAAVGEADHDVKCSEPILALEFYETESIDTFIRVLNKAKKVLKEQKK